MSQLVDNCFEHDELNAKLMACEQINLQNKRIKLHADDLIRQKIVEKQKNSYGISGE
jgi:hypothetical protein